jgi:hypothetical protein
VLSGTCAQHLSKLLHQVIGQINFWVHLTKLGQCLLLLDPEFFRATEKEESSLSGGWESRCLRRGGSLMLPPCWEQTDQVVIDTAIGPLVAAFYEFSEEASDVMAPLMTLS